MISNFKKKTLKSTVTSLLLIMLVGLVGLTGYKVEGSAFNTQNNKNIYKSVKFGFAITFPSNWIGKYKINETNQGINIYLKPKTKLKYGNGWLFSILKKTKNLDESRYDSVCSKKEIKIKGNTYFIGGPTDIGVSEKDPEFLTYKKLKQQIPTVVNSIK
jgi:hypothetical protein